MKKSIMIRLIGITLTISILISLISTGFVFTVSAVSNQIETVVIDTNDTASGWVSDAGDITVDTAAKEGAGAVNFADVNGVTGSLVIRKDYATPFDLSEMNTLAGTSLDFWVKVSDVSALQNVVIALFPTSGVSGGAPTWNWGPSGIRYVFPASDFATNTWKKISITKSTVATHGDSSTFEWGSLKLVRLEVGKTADMPFNISFDTIAFTRPVAPTPTPTPTPAIGDTVIDTNDTASGWVSDAGDITVDTAAKEGAGAVNFADVNGVTGSLVIRKDYATPFDLSEMNTLAGTSLDFWVKVSDVSALQNVVIALFPTSGVSGGAPTWNWGPSGIRYVFPASDFATNTWKKISITKSTVATHGDASTFEWGSLKLVRLEVGKTADMPFNISFDTIAFTRPVAPTPTPTPTPVIGNTVIDTNDTASGWVSDAGDITVDTAAKEGVGAVNFADVNGVTGSLVIRKDYATPFDLSEMNTLAGTSLDFWVKVSDVSALQNVVIALFPTSGVSGGAPTWNWGPSGIRYVFPASDFATNTWKKISITKSTVATHGDASTFEWGSLKLVRLEVGKTADMPFNISFDTIAFTRPGTTPPTNSDILIANFDTLSGWGEEIGGLSIDNNSYEGVGSLNVTDPTGTTPYLVTKKFLSESLDLSSFMLDPENKIEFWAKASDVSTLNNLQLMIFSEAGVTNGTINWSNWVNAGIVYNFLPTGMTNNNWMKFSISPSQLAEPGNSSTMDWSKIKAIRLVANKVTDMPLNVSFDKLALIKPQPPVPSQDFVVDNCDVSDGWIERIGSVSIDALSKEGIGAVNFADVNGVVANIVVDKLLNPSVDMTSIKTDSTKGLVFWVKVSDTSALNEVVISLFSDAGVTGNGPNYSNWDTSGIRYAFPVNLFKSNTWKKISIDYATAPTHGNPAQFEWNKVKLFRIEAGKKTDMPLNVSLDNIMISSAEQEPVLDAVIDDCESTNGWETDGVGWFRLSDKDFAQTGDYSLLLSATALDNVNYLNRIKKFSPYINLSTLANIEEKSLHMWINISDLTAVTAFRVVMKDINGKSVIYTLNKEDFILNSFSKIQIKPSDIPNADPLFNYARVASIEFQVDKITDKALTIAIDDIEIYDFEEVIQITPPEMDPVSGEIMDNMDDNDDGRWMTNSGTIETLTNYFMQGDGALRLNFGDSTTFMMSKICNPLINAFDIQSSGYKVSLWVRTVDVSKISQITLKLSTEADGSKNYAMWTKSNSLLVNGEWSELVFASTDATIDGLMRFNKIKNIQITIDATDSNTVVDIDGLTLFDPTADSTINLMDSNCDSADDWINPHGELSVDTVTQKEGTGALKLHGKAPIALQIRKFLPKPANLVGMSMMDSNALSVWVKSSNAAQISNFTIDLFDAAALTSNGLDVTWQRVKRWQYTPEILSSGEWVELRLTEFDSERFPTWNDAGDYSKMKMISITLIAEDKEANIEFFVDNIKYISLKGDGGESQVNDDNAIDEQEIDNNDLFTPSVLDTSIIAFLKYKAVVKPGTKVDTLLSSISLLDGYSASIVDKEGNEVSGLSLIEKGMWVIIKNDTDGIIVESYYIEIGNPKDTSNIQDVDMQGRPGANGGNPETSDSTTAPLFMFLIVSALIGCLIAKHYQKEKKGNI